MIRFLIQKPIGVLTICIAIICLGIISAFQIPISLLPDIAIPEINVRVESPKESAQQIEDNIVSKLRQSFQQLDAIEDINSESYNGYAKIQLRFKHQSDINLNYLEVNELIDRLMKRLPKSLERPQVSKANASDLPAFYLNIIPDSTYWHKNNNLLELSYLSEYVIKKRLEQLPDIGLVDISGQSYSEIIISPRKERFRALGFSKKDLERCIQQNHQLSGSILIKDGQYQYHLNFGTELQNIKQIQDLWMSNETGRLIQLKDIIHINKQERPTTGKYYYNDKQAIVMAISKQADARMEDLSINMQKMLKVFREEYPNIQFEISRDQTQLLKYSISNLFQSLMWGMLLSLLIMFVFIQQIREPLIMAISIPTSLLICLLLFHALGISINIISLSGLVLGVGMMIDNSIIVIDNINQYIAKDLSVDKACDKGTSEVIKPLLSSALTTCSVFIPLIFLSDVSGALFFDQAMAVCLGLLSSFLVSIMVLPVIFRLFHRNPSQKAKAKNNRNGLLFLEKMYLRHIEFLFKRLHLNTALFFLLIPLGWLLFNCIPKEAMPKFHEKAFIATVNWNEPLSIEENAKRCLLLQEQMEHKKLLFNIQIGKSSFLNTKDQSTALSGSQFYILASNHSTCNTAKKNMQEVLLKHYPNAHISIQKPKTVFEQVFNQKEAKLIARFYTKGKRAFDQTQLQELSKALYAEGLILNQNNNRLEEEIHLTINNKMLLYYRIEAEQLKQELNKLFNQSECINVQIGEQELPVIIGSTEQNLHQKLQTAFVENEDNTTYPLNQFISINRVQAMKSIQGNEEGHYTSFIIQSNNIPSSISQTLAIGEKFPNLKLQLLGDWFESRAMISQLIHVLLISILMLYFILAAQFESLLLPAIILLEVVFDLSGAFIMLLLFGQSLNLMSAIGIIVVSGIIINDSILKIDAIKQLQNQGYTLLDAIHEGGRKRLRPIIMTSLTTILALIPLLFSSGMGADLQKPLALAVIGGMLIGTIVSLYFIPLIYMVIYKRKARNHEE